MSVLINAEMPPSCRVCKLSQPDGVGWICPIVPGRPVVDHHKKTRHPRCPLVEIPAHGRLIDADALAAYDNDDFDKSPAKTDNTVKLIHLFIQDRISRAPTIIPAEDTP